jgi:hypothetical protein
MKLIVFVHTCKAYEESRAKLIEQTWGDQENVVFITDNPASTLKRSIYIGEYKRGPTYHPENVMKMFSLFLTHFAEYDWFMIVDDDSYVFLDKLQGFLDYVDSGDCYMIAEFLNWTAMRTEPEFTCDYMRWASGGPGMVFTKKAIETFVKLFQINRIPYINHDVWLHEHFMKSNKRMKRLHCPGFHQYRAKELIETYPIESKLLISLHLERDMSLIKVIHERATRE